MANPSFIEQFLAWSPGQALPQGAALEASLDELCTSPVSARGLFISVFTMNTSLPGQPGLKGKSAGGFILGSTAYLHVHTPGKPLQKQVLVVNPGFLRGVDMVCEFKPAAPIPYILQKNAQGLCFNYMKQVDHGTDAVFPFMEVGFRNGVFFFMPISEGMKKVINMENNHKPA